MTQTNTSPAGEVGETDQPLSQDVPDRIWLLDLGSGDIVWSAERDPDGEQVDAVAYVRERPAASDTEAMRLHIVFDGPPGPEAGRFVEVETPDGRSVNAGTWHERDDGFWELRIDASLAKGGAA